MRALLLATTNRHKLAELQAILSDLPYQLHSLHDVHLDMDVEETGSTFRANAELKALAYARASGMLTLADDSGLDIDALGGEPGVYSARFAGPETSYGERFRIIFERLRHVPPALRSARFRCVIAVAEPSGKHQSVEGVVEGIITHEARGQHGFGYDPIFLLPTLGQTTAELPPEEKNLLSHRARAAQQARLLLQHWEDR
jgi:XTP/dITP diphosphohydrolase